MKELHLEQVNCGCLEPGFLPGGHRTCSRPGESGRIQRSVGPLSEVCLHSLEQARSSKVQQVSLEAPPLPKGKGLNSDSDQAGWVEQGRRWDQPQDCKKRARDEKRWKGDSRTSWCRVL